MIDRTSLAAALAGGGVLCAVALVVGASVLSRWATSQSIPGDFELVQTGLALAVFAFLPFCQLRGRNLMIDTFTARAPAALRAGLDALWALIYGLIAAGLAVGMAVGAGETITSHTTSMVLALPIGWAMAVAALLLAWLGVVCLATAAASCRNVRT